MLGGAKVYAGYPNFSVFENCLIENNTCNDNGGFIQLGDGAQVLIKNSVLRNNR